MDQREHGNPAAGFFNRIAVWMRALRVRQWLKNVLVFLPLVFAHRWSDSTLLLRSALAFVVYCAAASAVYLANDLLDVEADRLHTEKRHRPLAAGLITRSQAWAISASLFIAGAWLAGRWLSPAFLLFYVLYVASAAAYSFGLKRIMVIDAILLASFYTLRIFAGSIATGIVVSEWLLLFSLFFFLGLAFQKRFSELRQWQDAIAALNRRGYVKADTAYVGQLGMTSSYLAVLVLALYMHAPEVETHYARPEVLWWVLPCVLYWTSRIWLLAARGELKEDAVAFALRDGASYATGIVITAIALIARPI